MNETEIENIERRAYENAVFATDCSYETADKYVEKIYSIYFSQNQGNSMIEHKTELTLMHFLKIKAQLFVPC